MRKITVDNSVKNIPKSEQTRERDINPMTIKILRIIKYKTKIFHRTKLKFIKNLAASGFGLLKVNKELLHLFKKHTDTFIENTKTKSQETLDFEMIKQRKLFHFTQQKN